jgi:predicted hydrocarbon binding protein
MTEKMTDNFIMRVQLETIQNVVGENGLKSILNYGGLKQYIDNFPPENNELEIPARDVQKLYLTLIELFGTKGAWGLQVRSGREFVRIFLEKSPTLSKTVKIATKFLSETKRMKFALEQFIDQDNKRFTSESGDSRVTLQEREDGFLIIYTDNHLSEGVTSQEPICGAIVGNLQELVEWITGHEHEVREIQCQAMGHETDVFFIAKSRKESG